MIMRKSSFLKLDYGDNVDYIIEVTYHKGFQVLQADVKSPADHRRNISKMLAWSKAVNDFRPFWVGGHCNEEEWCAHVAC